ncbi:small multidrug resistance protein [Chroococcidiopsis sp. CCALA 051]|uniref:DMT family transporter n=1 Tax=Chroococcidiopsis sp. CCALA 051 TaxID=869949 RepID=UPI000D0D9428|nr:SMR family transporter [Chroococcidiopsis sp. CCALA 051]MBE9016288.1 EamA family transporter [Chroococcidiopsidales cyanobacterium LEGE 13417]PSM47916.1 small multidrug resistance protein [Chroococcidiopsis sp. CCALA 051]
MNQFLQQPWLLVAVSACCSCTGSLLLKQSRLVTKNPGFLAMVVSPWFIMSLIAYSTGLILFAKALDRLPVSIAVPFSTGLGFILITILSHYLFGERLSISQLAASSLIIVGIIAIAR